MIISRTGSSVAIFTLTLDCGNMHIPTYSDGSKSTVSTVEGAHSKLRHLRTYSKELVSEIYTEAYEKQYLYSIIFVHNTQ